MTDEQSLSYMHALLRKVVESKASDLFISADFPPAMKVDGKMTLITQQKLTGEYTRAFANVIMNEQQRKEFELEKECNFAFWPKGIGRFRINVFMQQEKVGMVLRSTSTQIPKFDDLGLPPVLKEVVMAKRGIIIVAGGSDSGKSTTLAALIDYRNEHSFGHIITIEESVEYVHPSKNCLVSHREIGRDTHGWLAALKNVLHQAPDVVVIGELRDRETMEFGLKLAESGHLCIATLHASNASQALDRIVNAFPQERQAQLTMDLSLNLQAVISQRLVPKKDGGRCAAVEILLNTPMVAEHILKNETSLLKETMSKSVEPNSEGMGMQTFDQALFKLYEADWITEDEAFRNAESLNELRLKFKLHSKKGKSQHKSTDHLGHITLQNENETANKS